MLCHVKTTPMWFPTTTESETPFLSSVNVHAWVSSLKLDHEARQMRPADVLIPNWELGKPAAIDPCVTSPLNSDTLQVACVTLSSAAMQAEQRKHHSNDAKCGELGWVCIPLVVESHGSWEPETQHSLSRLAGRLATRLGQPKSITTNLIYGSLNLTLIRTNSRAILSRVCVCHCNMCSNCI